MNYLRISRILSSLALCGFVFLGACAKAPPKTSQSLPATPPKFQSLSSFVQVSVEAKGKKESFDAAVVLLSPDKLRVEILDDFGQVVSRLVADGNQVLWWRAREDVYMLLPQEAGSLKKTLRLPLTIEDFIRGMLLGSPGAANNRYLVEYTPAAAGNPYPERVAWQFLKPKARLDLSMQDPETNVAPPLAKFDTAPPPGAMPGKIR